jgi:hypothetical protein
LTQICRSSGKIGHIDWQFLEAEMSMSVPGWRSGPRDEGLVALRLGGLTDYQLRNGCLPEVIAKDYGELWLLCDAQTRLAERVAFAEYARNHS